LLQIARTVVKKKLDFSENSGKKEEHPVSKKKGYLVPIKPKEVIGQFTIMNK